MFQFFKYPQTDLNQQNLDWMIQTIKDLQKQIGSGGVQVVDTVAEMTDVNVIYVYVGSEPGMNTDHWYYYDAATSSWIDGGSWGGASVTLPLAITDGGTGATTVAGARNALGLGNTSGALPIANGGTGKTTAATAWTALGGGAAGKLDTVDVAHGGTGETTVAGARNALGLGNTSGALPIANGGTGSQNAPDARSALGITPANIGAVSTADLPLSIDKGGTGETTAAGIKTALDIADVKGMTYKAVAGNANIDLTLGNGRHGIIITTGSGSGQLDLVLFNVTNSGVITYVSIRAASSLTYTASTNNLNIANGASTYTFIFIIEF